MLDYTFYRKNLVNKTVQWHQSDREENYKSERMPYMEPEGMEENYKAERMPYFEPEGLEGYVSEAERRMTKNNMPGMQKGGMVRGQGIALKGTKFKGVF